MSSNGEPLPACPTNAVGFCERGIAHLNEKQFDRAVLALSEAIRLDPKFVDALIQRAIAFHSMGDFDRAVSDLTEAIRLEPDNGWAYKWRAICLDLERDGLRELTLADVDDALDGPDQCLISVSSVAQSSFHRPPRFATQPRSLRFSCLSCSLIKSRTVSPMASNRSHCSAYSVTGIRCSP